LVAPPPKRLSQHPLVVAYSCSRTHVLERIISSTYSAKKKLAAALSRFHRAAFQLSLPNESFWAKREHLQNDSKKKEKRRRSNAKSWSTTKRSWLEPEDKKKAEP
jgi:hypothetical protein